MTKCFFKPLQNYIEFVTSIKKDELNNVKNYITKFSGFYRTENLHHYKSRTFKSKTANINLYGRNLTGNLKWTTADGY